MGVMSNRNRKVTTESNRGRYHRRHQVLHLLWSETDVQLLQSLHQLIVGQCATS